MVCTLYVSFGKTIIRFSCSRFTFHRTIEQVRRDVLPGILRWIGASKPVNHIRLAAFPITCIPRISHEYFTPSPFVSRGHASCYRFRSSACKHNLPPFSANERGVYNRYHAVDTASKVGKAISLRRQISFVRAWIVNGEIVDGGKGIKLSRWKEGYRKWWIFEGESKKNRLEVPLIRWKFENEVALS